VICGCSCPTGGGPAAGEEFAKATRNKSVEPTKVLHGDKRRSPSGDLKIVSASTWIKKTRRESLLLFPYA